MKILLVGEYNKTHYNIKKGLEHLGHEAKVVATKDGFKKVSVDIEIKDYFNVFLLKKLRVLIYNIFKIDLLAISVLYQFKRKRKQLSGYDLIQYVNEAPFHFERKSHLKIFKWLNRWNQSPIFLLSCGLDYISVKHAFDKKYRYNILTPYFENKGSKKDFSPALSYISAEHKTYHNYVFSKIRGVIANDFDYHVPLVDHPKYLGFIPHAIDTDILEYNLPKIEDKIVIFHGINRFNYYKKGNDIFEDALTIIKRKFAEKVDIITVENLPYKTYINSFNKAHILLDQVYAYDQGYNALEAMAKGKVVFTGAEQEWLEHFNLEADSVAINALPDVKDIVNKLEWLILHPEEIIRISKNASAFVKRHHHYLDCTKQYLNLWNTN